MTHDDDDRADPCAGHLLLVGEGDLVRLVGETLESDGHRCDRAGCVREARRRVLESHYDAIVLDLDSLAGGALEVVQLVSRLSPATVCILRSRTISVATVLAAMRAGLGDFLGGTLSVPQVRRRLRAAVRRARESRRRFERMARLAANARSLATDGSSLPGAEAVDGIDAASDDAIRDDPMHDDDAPHAAMGPDRVEREAESTAPCAFAVAASQQLDPERLVTVAIEHLVDRLGPVNVAVYLGTGSVRFGLAAYARADLPRALIERPLAQWSSGVCIDAALDGRPSVHHDASNLPIEGDEAREVLSRRGAMIVPCRVEGACDAVFVILTPGGTWPFDAVADELAVFGRTFGEQLARIQRIHSRHRPWWPTEDD